MLKKNYPYYRHKKVKTFAEFLELIEKKYDKKVVFSWNDGDTVIKKTYAEFVSDVRNLANFLNKNYVGKHLAICGENSYNWFVTFMAVVVSGNIAVPVDRDCNAELLLKLLDSADCDALFYSEKYIFPHETSPNKFKIYNAQIINIKIRKVIMISIHISLTFQNHRVYST